MPYYRYSHFFHNYIKLKVFFIIQITNCDLLNVVNFFFPKVIRNRTKPSAGLDEDEAKEEAAKYRSASEASIKPHTDVCIKEKKGGHFLGGQK
jgi:hypothetical protein